MILQGEGKVYLAGYTFHLLLNMLIKLTQQRKGAKKETLTPCPLSHKRGEGKNQFDFHNSLFIMHIRVFPSLASKRGDYGVSYTSAMNK